MTKFYTLKSNMDRFIARSQVNLNEFYSSLKSNMDRFIVIMLILFLFNAITLKSNMDRFIVIQQQRLISIQCL